MQLTREVSFGGCNKLNPRTFVLLPREVPVKKIPLNNSWHSISWAKHYSKTKMSVGTENLLPATDNDTENIVEIGAMVNDALIWCSVNGLVMGDTRSSNYSSNPGTSIMHAPVALFPTYFPKILFQQALKLATHFNELTEAVSKDPAFLNTTLKEASKSDPFTARLLEIYTTVLKEKGSENLSVGMHRSDYMVDVASNKLLQVELNTISTSFPGLSSRVSQLHGYILEKYGKKRGIEELKGYTPENPSTTSMVEALAVAWREMGNKSAFVLMVVQSPESNQYDQHWLSLELWNQHKVPLIRKTLEEIYNEAKLDENGWLIIDSTTQVSVVYFRAGYGPADYPTEKEWAARLLLERSSAAKCPSVAYHLAGAKKVQQELARPGVLERFTQSEESASLLRECFAGLWALDEESSREAIEEALENPQNFVLKPQREGGGNNIYGADLSSKIQELQKSDKSALSSYILMQRIFPEVKKSILIKRGEWSMQNTLSELGIYSVFVKNKDKVLLNKAAGHLLRTKSANSDEGGVASGYAVLDSPFLV